MANVKYSYQGVPGIVANNVFIPFEKALIEMVESGMLKFEEGQEFDVDKCEVSIKDGRCYGFFINCPISDNPNCNCTDKEQLQCYKEIVNE